MMNLTPKDLGKNTPLKGSIFSFGKQNLVACKSSVREIFCTRALIHRFGFGVERSLGLFLVDVPPFLLWHYRFETAGCY